jgi:hypothetical protein
MLGIIQGCLKPEAAERLILEELNAFFSDLPSE